MCTHRHCSVYPIYCQKYSLSQTHSQLFGTHMSLLFQFHQALIPVSEKRYFCQKYLPDRSEVKSATNTNSPSRSQRTRINKHTIVQNLNNFREVFETLAYIYVCQSNTKAQRESDRESHKESVTKSYSYWKNPDNPRGNPIQFHRKIT